MSETINAMAVSCPSCGGSLIFDPAKGKLVCDYCDLEFDPQETGEYWKNKEEKNLSRSEWEIESDGMRGYSCTACGAELIADAISAVIRCPYCGNQTVVPAQFAGGIRPDYIIPFSKTKEEAMEKYGNYYNKRFLLPKSFKTKSRVEEIQGVYVPFWLFSGNAVLTGRYKSGDTLRKEKDHKIIKLYDVKREGRVDCNNIPADASKRMDDGLMDCLEPYDPEGMKEFSIAYLPGFMAERFDVSQDENRERAEKRVKKSVEWLLYRTVEHEKTEEMDEKVDFEWKRKDYALFPVWLLTTRYGKKEYKFAMNGQTGEMTGDLPISAPKFIISIIVLLLVSFFVGSWFAESNIWGAVIAVIATVLGALIMESNMKPVTQACTAGDHVSREIEMTVKEDIFIGEEKRSKFW